MAQLAAETDLAKAQISLNQAEATSSSLWNSGWRPYVGWVCGTGFAYHVLLQPSLSFLLSVFGYSVNLPVFDTELMSTTLYGMLGFGALRSFDKSQLSILPRRVRKTDVQFN